MRRPLTNTGPETASEFELIVRGARRSLWRWEQQPAYWIGTEQSKLDAFLAGHPKSPADIPDLAEWYRFVSELTAEGTVGRVRVVDDPPTAYQRWMRYTDSWNTAAGEVIDYLPRRRLAEIGPPPFEPECDWWLVDDARLVIISYDNIYRPSRTELIEDEPEVEMAKTWRDVVVSEARTPPRA